MLSEIGRKLVMTKSWRWMPGMLTLGGDRVRKVGDNGNVFLDRGYVSLDDSGNWIVVYPPLDESDLPDAHDPATIGAMMEVLERSSGLIQSLVYIPQDNLWSLCTYGENSFQSFVRCTREEALLGAFESLD